MNDINADGFQYLLDNKQKFIKIYGDKKVHDQIWFACRKTVRTAAKAGDEASFNKAKMIIKNNLGDKAGSHIGQLSMTWYADTDQWDKYAGAASEYVNEFAMDDVMDNAGTLNSIAWKFYEKVDDKQYLEQAEKWAARSVELKEKYFNTDTYTAVLYKLGKYKEAKKMAKRAIKLAKKEERNYSLTEELLEKINSSLTGKI